jgi:hypothetical protein
MRGYIVKEILTFFSNYFKPHLKLRIKRVPNMTTMGKCFRVRTYQYFLILDNLYQKVLRGKYLKKIKFRHAHNYMLFNCDELRSFIQ